MTTGFTPSSNHTPNTFTDYNKTKLALISDLEKLRSFSKKLNLKNSIPQIEKVLNGVHSETFSVAIVGEFNRGKSTFINALLGREILPANILPCSATLNRVTYGIKSKVQVIFQDGRKREIDIDALSDYVTKLTPESKDRAVSIKEAVVYYPVPYCQNGVDIIDTPGLNDEDSMTKITQSVLPNVDAAIMVMFAQASFAETERRFLEEKLLETDMGRIIFVLTGIDRCKNEGEIDEVIRYAKDRIENMILSQAREKYGADSPEYEVYRKKIGKPRIYGLSAYEALEAKLSGDNPRLLAKSRFPEFETALEKFLTAERGATFLQVPLNRIIASATEIIKTLDIRDNALHMDQLQFRSAYEKSVTEIQELRDLSTTEMDLIDEASAKVKAQIDPLVNQLESTLKQAALEVVEITEIKPTELRNKKAIIQKLGVKVSKAVEKAAKQQAEKIQETINQGLLQEINRLQDLANSVDLVLNRIEMEFSTVNADTRLKARTDNETVTTAAMRIPILGGAWLGYREAGMKGAAVGAAGTVGTAYAAAFVASAVSIPATWPVIAILGVLSAFSGGWLTKVIFRSEQVANFKENYRDSVCTAIEKQLQDAHVSQKVDAQVTNIFRILKEKVRTDVNSLLDDTQSTLADLDSQLQRDEVMTEHKQQELASMRRETDRILGNAQRMSEQLFQQVNL